MTKLITSVYILIFFTGLYNEKLYAQKINRNYEINGHITGKYEGNVYLVQEEGLHGPQKIIDSCEISDNFFSFKGIAPEHSTIHFIKSEDGQIAPFFLEPGKIDMNLRSDFFLGAKSRGTVNNQLWGLHQQQVNFIRDSVKISTLTDWMRLGRGTHEFEDKEFKRRTKFLNTNKLNMEKRMVNYYSNEVFAPFIVLFEMTTELSLKELKDIRSKFSAELDNHPYTKQLDEIIIQKNFKVGSEAPPFSIVDMNGQEIELKNYKGKYVLLDFWASWCGPCRREMPNIVKLYNKFKNKNFEIIGISLDTDEQKWKNAVTKMNMTWPQACDFRMWESPVARKYNVLEVPTMILINPKGKVETLGLRGKALHNKIDELLNK